MIDVSHLIGGALVYAFGAVATGHGLYSIAVESDHPSELGASLEIRGGSAAHSRLAFVRGTRWGLSSQVSDPSCDGRPLDALGASKWTVPAGCRRIEWKIRMRPAHDGAIDASAQASTQWSDRPLWLVSEPTSLLHVEGDNTDSELVIVTDTPLDQVGATRLSNGHWKVPAVDSPPEFYVVGKFDAHTVKIASLSVRYVADDAHRVAALGLERAHRAALEYLATLLPPPRKLGDSERGLLVVWIGADKDQHRSGGAAGSRSFLANYSFGPGASPVDRVRTFATIAHEQFHQLVDMTRGARPALPVWVNESLATYYGIEALQKIERGDAVAEFRASFIDPSRPVTQGLIGLQRRYDAGDASVYPLFYSQGATLWSELDRALRAAGDPGLDALLTDLVASTFRAHGELPAPFVAMLVERLGREATRILDRYL